jgi:2-polyprenyl-6-methoxyphenol hydroxylase-like FAD-dependent oxidoreductase
MRRAVVIGGSIAGMGAARALQDFFDEVVIVDRDAFPAGVAFRSGAPQSRHAHALLERGQQELETLFPGFIAEMKAAGAQTFDPGLHVAVHRTWGWQDVGAYGTELLWGSRSLLEFTVRKLLRAQTRVKVLERAQVLGLCVSCGPDRRVTGIKLRSESGEVQELAAELVVDTSGRHTRADDWLKGLGLAPPRCDRVDAHLGYATRLYQQPARRPASWWWKSLWIEWQPPSLARAGVIFPIEDDRWLVTLAGIGDDMPPVDERGFNAFMQSLSTPLLAEAVSLATPLSGITGHRSLANVFRRYDSWPERLPGFVSLGDATCAFNPIYGQGMSVAVACASLLRAQLAETGAQHPDFAPSFFQRQASLLKQPWGLATRADFVWPTTEGRRPQRSRPIVSSYIRLALECTHADAALRRQIQPVFNLTGSRALFFRPRFVAGVLFAGARRWIQRKLFGAPVANALPLGAGTEHATSAPALPVSSGSMLGSEATS